MTKLINPYEQFSLKMDLEKMREPLIAFGLIVKSLGENKRGEWLQFPSQEQKVRYTIEQIKEAFFCHNDSDCLMPEIERKIRQESWKSFKRYLNKHNREV